MFMHHIMTQWYDVYVNMKPFYWISALNFILMTFCWKYSVHSFKPAYKTSYQHNTNVQYDVLYNWHSKPLAYIYSLASQPHFFGFRLDFLSAFHSKTTSVIMIQTSQIYISDLHLNVASAIPSPDMCPCRCPHLGNVINPGSADPPAFISVPPSALFVSSVVVRLRCLTAQLFTGNVKWCSAAPRRAALYIPDTEITELTYKNTNIRI